MHEKACEVCDVVLMYVKNLWLHMRVKEYVSAYPENTPYLSLASIFISFSSQRTF